MKVLIVSDTHGRLENLERVIEMTKPIDALIHLGDVEGQEDYIRRLVPCAAYMVSGNNDFFSMLPRELEFELGKYKVLITHGHYYYVSLNRFRDAVCSIIMLFFFLARVNLYIGFMGFMQLYI